MLVVEMSVLFCLVFRFCCCCCKIQKSNRYSQFVVCTLGSDQPRQGEQSEGIWCWKTEIPKDLLWYITEDVYHSIVMRFTPTKFLDSFFLTTSFKFDLHLDVSLLNVFMMSSTCIILPITINWGWGTDLKLFLDAFLSLSLFLSPAKLYIILGMPLMSREGRTVRTNSFQLETLFTSGNLTYLSIP